MHSLNLQKTEGKAPPLLPAKVELLIVTTWQDLDSSSAKIQELGFRFKSLISAKQHTFPLPEVLINNFSLIKQMIIKSLQKSHSIWESPFFVNIHFILEVKH